MAGIQQVEPILARLKADGQTSIGSLQEFMDWVFASKEHLRLVLPNRDADAISANTGIPVRVVRAILYSRQFIAALHDELLYRKFPPDVWERIYDAIIPQLTDPSVPLGAKRSMIEHLKRDMGLEKPRKLSVKQQTEIEVRVELVQPRQVMEVLGVPVDEVPQLEAENPLPGGRLDHILGGMAEDVHYEPVPADDGGRQARERTGGDAP